jgi:hypothetical protein
VLQQGGFYFGGRPSDALEKIRLQAERFGIDLGYEAAVTIFDLVEDNTLGLI